MTSTVWRLWGYYALPILHGDRLVGKLDASVDRKGSVLRINAIHEDVLFSRQLREAVRGEIDELASWLGLGAIEGGRRYETVLEVVRYDPAMKESVVVAGWGGRTAWLHNVEAGGALAVATGRRRYAPAHRLLDADEAFAVVAAYERRNRFIAPVVRAVLSRLVGWRYDGTDAARRRLVVQLPMLAFRPRSHNFRRGRATERS